MSVPVPCEVDGCEGETLGRVCGGCRARFETALRSIPDDPDQADRLGEPRPGLATELEVTRTRQHRTVPDGPQVTSSPTRPLAWDARADEASATLWAALAGWYEVLAPALPEAPCACRLVCADYRQGPLCWAHHCWAWEVSRIIDDRVPEPPALPGLATWMLRHVEDVMAHPDAGFAVSDMLAAVTVAERAVDAPPALVYAGPCDYCEADLYGRHGKASVTCIGRRDEPGCGTVYSAAAKRAELLESLREHTATAAEIAHGVAELVGEKIDRRKLNVWAGRVVDTATDPETGRAEGARPKLPDRRTPDEFREGRDRVYRIGEVLDLIAAGAIDRQAASVRRRATRAATVAEQPPARGRADLVATWLDAVG